ncbi:outer membrane beta-barrel family protein [Flavobacterium psychrotrophum]|uniref:outer membrane beta-barrel family protein n=1 Tax=Flavobacterium psychrotrophum TaxID=2294119 RepID=UPI000E312AFB|nr:outer membrane beta-barrel family protein [Flavobacterium psychrotrophum]
MKLHMLWVLLMGSIMTITAQTTGNISGKITDKTSGQSLPFVSVVVKDGATTVASDVATDNGDFNLKNLPLKSYTVEVQFMGYKTYVVNAALTAAKPSLNLGTIALTEEATTLDTVEIVKETSTIEQKIDRKVITVGRDLTTAGATASEIMNNIPSVNVDQDGNISLRGNANVRVLIDGRPTTIDAATLLKQIPSTSIKKIELITSPSAKYNPEGMSGIINIILNKNANDGFNGSFNAGLTFGETPKYNNSLDMNYRTGKVNFFANGGTNGGKYFNGGVSKRLDTGANTLIDVTNDNTGFLAKVGMDYYINDFNTLSVYTNQNQGSGKAAIGSDVMYPEGSPFENILQHSKLDGDNHNNTYNLAFKHKFEKEGHTLDFEANYNTVKSTQDADYETTTGAASPVFYNDDVLDKRKNITANLDYVNPLNDKTTLELGAEARIIRTDNEYQTTRVLENPSLQNSVYSYDNDIYSAYATFGQKFDKFSYQLGLRAEHFTADADFNKGATTFENKYFTVYPSAFASYAINDKNTVQISYSRRVDRPSLEQTKPIREFSTPQFTSLGNQRLEPQFTNSVEANYTRMLEKGSSITGGIFYRLIDNEINRVIYPDETTPNTQDQIMSYANFGHNSSYGFELSANYKITKWWDVQPAIDFNSISQQGTVAELKDGSDTDFEFVSRKIKADAFNARLNSNFRVNQRLSFLLFGFYRSGVNGVQSNSRDMYKIDSGARYTLLDNKMSLSLRFSDMFKTMRYAFDSRNPFPQTGEFRWESRTVYFGLNYMFGAGKNRAMQRKAREDNTTQGSGGMF